MFSSAFVILYFVIYTHTSQEVQILEKIALFNSNLQTRAIYFALLLTNNLNIPWL